MENIYQNGTYISNIPDWHAAHSPWKAGYIAQILKQYNIDPETIAEVGCGAGEILNELYRQLGPEKKYSGYEISTDAFSICKMKEKPNLSFFLKDFLDEPDSGFDLVLCIDVFEHVPDYLDFLNRLKEKAEYKIFHIPLDLSVQTLLRVSPITKGRNLYGHLHHFTKELALAALKDTGYEIIGHFYTPWSLELPERTLRHKIMSLPRRLCYKISADLTVRILGGYSLLVLTR